MPKTDPWSLTLASRWNPSDAHSLGLDNVGRPRFAIASTYTIEAKFVEQELLPRFLSLRFDAREAEQASIVERENALAETRVHVLVDANCADPSQTTLRWDQIPIRIWRGVQHSKLTLLVWENAIRAIVGSANLTAVAYRRRQEIYSCLDFWNSPQSTPRALLQQCLRFFGDMADCAAVAGPVRERLLQTISGVHDLASRWSTMPPKFGSHDRPRAMFVYTKPRPAAYGRIGQVVQQVRNFWGNRKATEIGVMTPSVGADEKSFRRAISALRKLPCTRATHYFLVAPATLEEGPRRRRRFDLPREFGEMWETECGEDCDLFAVLPQCLGKNTVSRPLHAKALYLADSSQSLLMIGSSNFSPHGYGIGVANFEANLAVLDRVSAKRDRAFLYQRLPVDWMADQVQSPSLWQEEGKEVEDKDDLSEDQKLPQFLNWATYAPVTGELVVSVSVGILAPQRWSISLSQSLSEDGEALLFDSGTNLPVDGRLVKKLPKDVQLTALKVAWMSAGKQWCQRWLAVQVESVEQLIPPAEVRSLSLQMVIDILLSGRDPAEYVDERDKRSARSKMSEELDPLRLIDTTDYLLYRMRRFGRALSGMEERLWQTVRSQEAFVYRLKQDPLGPLGLARALLKELEKYEQATPMQLTEMTYSLAEIAMSTARSTARLTRAEQHRLGLIFLQTNRQIWDMIDHLRDLMPVASTGRFADYLKSAQRQSAANLVGIPR